MSWWAFCAVAIHVLLKTPVLWLVGTGCSSVSCVLNPHIYHVWQFIQVVLSSGPKSWSPCFCDVSPWMMWDFRSYILWEAWERVSGQSLQYWLYYDKFKMKQFLSFTFILTVFVLTKIKYSSIPNFTTKSWKKTYFIHVTYFFFFQIYFWNPFLLPISNALLSYLPFLS